MSLYFCKLVYHNLAYRETKMQPQSIRIVLVAVSSNPPSSIIYLNWHIGRTVFRKHFAPFHAQMTERSKIPVREINYIFKYDSDN